ncbi:predicted protein [Phaeodactylum tricornutum CCAP 1055/1]|uniref:G8 domain-containing protein n=2 Tax=Phaeodactylum tricornutum TaxID=2850 RepID=B7G892_PHATC|nr:predicted protein [Phaeodactylum tricornutum CCAP 1055/1]EEC45131.1 predicted protein [Phaeodactylum tricornutum CCAP 1055/1]|eukprot:XP_002183431.1 predicted protein [Phaeodactylum tricornutum CCAP 1055/1]
MYSPILLGSVFLFLNAVECKGNFIRGNSSASSQAFDSEEAVPSSSRRLARGFVPLSCNANIDNSKCSSFIDTFGTNSVHASRLVVPCGTCVSMDHPGPLLTLNDGIDIQGKLVFPDGYRLTVNTNLVLVQGELEMKSSKAVDGIPDVTFVLQGSSISSFEPIDSNTGNCGGSCDTGARSITVAGGKVNLNGLPANTPTWLHIYDVIGSSAIVVSNSVRDKWVAGATIVITSEHQGFFGDQVRTISSVSDVGSGRVRLNLDKAINRPVTLLDSPDSATEVALLSRNIVFQGASGSDGGHFWIMHTPSVNQRIEGVEIVNFGQEGLLGRYPVHFHMCGDVSGSVVAKNTIRNSNQRCVVVHGTDNLLVQENVAYSTKGHCYMLEDGIETGNEFVRNIGILTVKADVIIPNMGSNGVETDMSASTFWITNADNSFVGNVVAGSQVFGFWFELQVRGSLANEHQDFDPMTVPTRKFEGNVVHSVFGVGLTYYLHGYIPKTLQYFENNKFFRNRHIALRIHRTRNIFLKGNTFSDNAFAIVVDRAEEIHVADTTIVGHSDVFAEVVKRNRFANMRCPQGIGFQSTNPWVRKMDSELNGVILDQVAFSGFSKSVCSDATAIDLTSRLDGYKSFEMFSRYTGVTVADTDVINFCSGKSAGADDVDTCIRTVHYYVPESQSQDYTLKVCDRGNTSDCIELSGHVHSSHRWPRRFAVHVPSGRQYDAVFLNKGVPVYPTNVDIEFQEKLCPTAPNDEDIVLLEKARGTTFPPTSSPTTSLEACGNLIANSDFERGYDGYWDAAGEGSLSNVAGYNSPTAMYYDSGNRNRYWTGPAHKWRDGLDFQCLTQGTTWKFSARMKLVDKETGKGASCNTGSTAEGEMCPRVTLVLRDKSWTLHTVPTSRPTKVPTDRPTPSPTKLATGLPTESPVMSPSVGDLDSCSEVIANSDFELGSKGYWSTHNGASVSDVEGFTSSTAMYYNSGNRKRYWQGPEYKGGIDLNCLEQGTTWKITAKLQLVDVSTGEGSSCVVGSNNAKERCPRVRLVLRDGTWTLRQERIDGYTDAESWDTNGMNSYTGYWTVPADGPNWNGKVRNFRLSLVDFPFDTDLVVDDFKMTRVS